MVFYEELIIFIVWIRGPNFLCYICTNDRFSMEN